MPLEDIMELCNSLPAVKEDIKWENDLVFSVGEKMFFVAALNASPTSASFKVADDEYEEMCTRPGFKPAPYLARHKWVYIDDVNRLTKIEWKGRIMQSYELVKQKLSSKIKKQLGLHAGG